MVFNVIQNVDAIDYTLYEGNDEKYAKQLTNHLIEEYAEELLFHYPEIKEEKALKIAKQRFSMSMAKTKNDKSPVKD